MFLGKWNEYNMAGMQQDLHSHSNLIVICFVNPVYLLQQAVKCKGSKPSGGMAVALSCPENEDEYNLIWESTVAGTYATLPCPNGNGTADRHCDISGKWQQSNTTNCSSTVYADLAEQAKELNNSHLDNFIKQLINLTKPTNISKFPRDLAAAVDAIDGIINITNSSDVINESDFVENVVQIHDNILDKSNVPGWTQLATVVHEQCEKLLLNLERFSIKLADTLNAEDNRTTHSYDNIVISVEALNNDSATAITWPTDSTMKRRSFANASMHNPSASIDIPADFVQSVGESSEDGRVLVANLAYRNFAPPSIDINGTSGVFMKPVSVILSSKVIAGRTTLDTSKQQSSEPITLKFDYSLDGLEGKLSNIRCGFWDEHLDQGGYFFPGGWSTEGVSVESVDDKSITCTSQHLTSFAVLVDVSGSHEDISETHRKALSIVSYIGCIICLICLTAAIILFVIYRIPLLKEIHNFIHLNLTIALFIALLIFVIGIELAAGNEVTCTMVATILHYFFTSVFTWMLCEGLMLYFLLVKVFNNGIGQRKLFYLGLGWGLPVPIVAIALGIAHDHYGTEDYCWLSSTNGTIWAFAAPTLVIITINAVFLGMALYVVVQNERFMDTKASQSHLKLVRETIKAAVILLPLLGLTWLFGFLAVNKESMVFAWIFTLLNSLQGAFILVLHVIRNRKVRSNLEKFYRKHTTKIFTAMMGEDNPSTLKTVNMTAISQTGHVVGSGGYKMNADITCSTVEFPGNTKKLNGIAEPTIVDKGKATSDNKEQ